MKSFIHSFKSIQSLNLLRSGEPYFNRLYQLIDEAKSTIHFQVYIFDLDITGNLIIEKLIAAAHRDVAVYLVVDAYASNQFTPTVVNRLTKEGIHIKLFAPITLSSFRIGRRLHHKVILIDEKIALIGGINIADKYAGYLQTPWLDIAIEITGSICSDIHELCQSIWQKKLHRKKQQLQQLKTPSTPINIDRVRLIHNDWWHKRIEISKAYRNAIQHSQKSVTIVASYFLPSYRKRKLIIDAAKRGVNVTLILGGNSDIPLMHSAIKYLYGVLLNNHIQIFEWNKSVLHAKFATVDGIWTTIGSYNLNALSDYGSIETNIEIEQSAITASANSFIQQMLLDGCTKIERTAFNKQNHLLIRFYRWLSYQSIRLSLFLLFLFMQRDQLKK